MSFDFLNKSAVPNFELRIENLANQFFVEVKFSSNDSAMNGVLYKSLFDLTLLIPVCKLRYWVLISTRSKFSTTIQSVALDDNITYV